MDGAEASGRPREHFDSDSVALLSGSQIPSIQVSSALDRDSSLRGRRHSRDLNNVELQLLRTGTDAACEGGQENASGHNRGPSPGPSTATSLFRRLTTLRSPVKRSHTSKRAQGAQYDTLDEGVDRVPVDLSSLAGMGYEVTDLPASPMVGSSSTLQDQETAYDSSSRPSEKPDFRTFVRRSGVRKLGDGMVIGAQLRRDPSRATPQAISSGWQADVNMVQRAKTTRNVGQSLAEQRQMIVAVTEQVDISSLEGTAHLNHPASTHSFAGMGVRNAMEDQPKSYYLPEDPETPNWRPFSMRTPYILMLAAVSLGLAVFQEWLYQHSVKKTDSPKGGLLAFDRVSDVSIIDFFTWKYLPTLITIAYAVLFSIMDFDIRRLEPYYQLSRPLGSRAASSLNLDHLTMFQYFVPFKAFRLKQWAVFFSTIGNIIASTVAPSIQNPSVNFVQNPTCLNGLSKPCEDGKKHFFVRINSAWSRALSSVLFVVAITTMVIFFLLRRKSGLLSDPKGIAGIASMATKSHILNDFQGLDLATRGEIHKRLQHRRFVLHKSSIWQGEWSAAVEPMQDSVHRMDSPHPHTLQLRFGIPFISFMIFGLLSVPLISLTGARVIPNTVPWLPILLATVLKLMFTTFESDVRMIEPFYQLSKRHAKPENSLTLDYQGTVYGWIVIRALLNRHWLVSLVGVASVSLDILTVTVSSFSINSRTFLKHASDKESNQDETFISFWTSVILSIVILTFVITVTSLVYLRRRHPFLPREPSTIAAVLAFIYASNMLDDFIDTERLTNKQMEERLKMIGKTYALGWFKGRDRKVHCAIDQEPIRSEYVHGKPYTLSQAAPWEGRGHDEFV